VIRFAINIDGIATVDAAAARFNASMADFRPAWPAIVADFYQVEAAQFDSLGAAGGTGWAPLSAKYAQWKEKHFPGKPILEQSGKLRRSLTEAGAERAIARKGMKQLTLGSSSRLAQWAQAGTGREPARPVMELGADFEQRCREQIAQYLIAAGREAGFGV